MTCLRNNKGFSLVELLVVIGILGILMTIAVPVYRGYTQRGHRAAAKAALLEDAQYMERYFTTHNTYNDTATPDPPVLPRTSTEGNTYAISFQGTPDATSFVIQAVPQGSQVGDKCGTLTIDHLGNKSADVAGCW